MNDDPASVSSAAVPTVPSRGDAASSRSGAVAAGWPLWQRLAFRYLLCYFVLYAFPGPLGMLLSNRVDQGWQAVTTWCDKHGLAPYEVIHQPTGSGDTGHEVMRLIVIALAFASFAALDRIISTVASASRRDVPDRALGIRTLAVSTLVMSVAARWMLERYPW